MTGSNELQTRKNYSKQSEKNSKRLKL